MLRFFLFLALLVLPIWGQSPAKPDALEITPARVELLPGEETQFGLRLRCSGLMLPVLDSSCTAGILEKSGRYIAPLSPGIYHVKVWAIDRNDLAATATVLVLPQKLPSIERFEYVAPSHEVAWKVDGATEVRLDPGAGNLPLEGQGPAPSDGDWITLWAANDAGSVTRVLRIPTPAGMPAPAPVEVHQKLETPAPSAPVVVRTPPSSAPPVAISVPPRIAWTLQMVVLAAPKAIQQLKDSGYLDQPGIFSFEIILAGGNKRATCVCYGRFSSSQEATQIIPRLPKELRLGSEIPVPRTIPAGI